MVKSVWQTTGCEHQFAPGPPFVQPEIRAFWAVSPVKAEVSSHPVLWLSVCTVVPDDVESVNPDRAHANFNVLCHSVLMSFAKTETPLVRFALEIRNPEILGSCYLFLLTGAVFFWPTLVSSGIHSHTHTHIDI